MKSNPELYRVIAAGFFEGRLAQVKDPSQEVGAGAFVGVGEGACQAVVLFKIIVDDGGFAVAGEIANRMVGTVMGDFE